MFSDPTNGKSKLQSFTRGQNRFGIAASEIVAIVDWETPTPLPHAPQTVMGVTGVHGRMLTVLDVARFSERGETSPSSIELPRKIIALRGDEQLALAADNVD